MIRDLEWSISLPDNTSASADSDRTWIRDSSTIIQPDAFGQYLFIRFWSDEFYVHPIIQIKNTDTGEIIKQDTENIASDNKIYYRFVFRLNINSFSRGFEITGTNVITIPIEILGVCEESLPVQARSNELKDNIKIRFYNSPDMQYMQRPTLGGSVHIFPDGIYNVCDVTGKIYNLELEVPFTEIPANYNIIPDNTVIAGLMDNGAQCTAPYLWHFDSGGMP